jgi:hypothetical protein
MLSFFVFILVYLLTFKSWEMLVLFIPVTLRMVIDQ